MSEYKNVNSVFSEHCSHLVFDKALAKKFNQYKLDFENKNEEHMKFFGGNLTGVHVVRHTTADKQVWFNDILSVNDIELERDILDLPNINANFHVSSDLFNLSCLWLIHKFLKSNLKEEDKKQAMMDICLCLNYKFVTSILYRYYRYPADPEIAAATYASLSFKFAIKQHGTWRKTLIARCEDFLQKDSLHYNVLLSFMKDLEIVNTLNDAQNRIRSMLKNITAEHHKTKALGVRITSTSSTSINLDGEEILKDRVSSLSVYSRYVFSVVTDKNSFVKTDLINVIAKAMHTMSPKLLTEMLEWISDNYTYDKTKEIDKLINLTLTHSFNYLSDNRSTLKHTADLPNLIGKLRGVYMSSRSTDVELIEMRNIGESLVKRAHVSKNPSTIAAVKTGMFLYICLRAFTMHHYSQ